MKCASPLTKEHLWAFCRPGEDSLTCRYLLCGTEGMFCGKGTVFQPLLDARVERMEIRARGDNCEGRKPEGATKPEALK